MRNAVSLQIVNTSPRFEASVSMSLVAMTEAALPPPPNLTLALGSHEWSWRQLYKNRSSRKIDSQKTICKRM